jgi:hypothetical protein
LTPPVAFTEIFVAIPVSKKLSNPAPHLPDYCCRSRRGAIKVVFVVSVASPAVPKKV